MLPFHPPNMLLLTAHPYLVAPVYHQDTGTLKVRCGPSQATPPGRASQCVPVSSSQESKTLTTT